jgi:hypothetical protein
MRTFLKLQAIVGVLALTFALSTASALAEKADWTKLPVQKVPAKVATGCHRLYAHSRILKAETSGSGAVVLYRLTIKGKKGKPEHVLFDAQGRPVKS